MAGMAGKISPGRLMLASSAWALGAALLALPATALAQDEHRSQGNGAHSQQSARPAPPGARGPAPAINQPRPAMANPAAGGWPRPQDYNPNARPQGNNPYARPPGNYPPAPPRAPYQAGGSGAWHDNGGNGQRSPGAVRDQPGVGRPQGNYTGPRGDSQWNHGWRQDQRYDWRGWRDANRDAFHAGRYYPPYRGYYYNRLSVGIYLQPLFFDSDYWIADPWYYHLPPAYGPYQWVRYFNDVLLVNTYNGEVADVIYDFFW